MRSRSSISTLLHHVADLGRLRDVHALDHVAEEVVARRELARAVVDADEELRAVRVGAGVRHRDRAERVLALHRLVGELVAGAAAAAALGAAALDHELGHDAVEREAVVVAVAREADEVVDGVRRELRVEIHHDRAAVGRDRGAVDLVASVCGSGCLRHDGSPCGRLGWLAWSVGAGFRGLLGLREHGEHLRAQRVGSSVSSEELLEGRDGIAARSARS